MTDLTRLLRPRSIAVVGGSAAAMVIRQCQLMGYDGEIWPVHPNKSEVEGLQSFPGIDDLPAAPDATFIGVNRHLTLDIIDALAKRGAGGAVCYASGFLEADEEGGGLQSKLLKLAGDMPVLGPNCYGFINYADGALLWPDQHGGQRLAEHHTGVAMITQSSNIAINLTMQRRGLPMAYILTAGNQAMVGVSDLALAVLDDPRVTCLGLYIEGFDSVVGMEAVARKARQLNKPIVALKVGKSEQAQLATLSHTASLAGAHFASQAFLKRIGVGQVDTLPSLLETLKFLHVHGTLDGYRLGSMSCSGGEASLVADTAHLRKVYFPDLTTVEKEAVQRSLGPMVTVNNPLDYHTYVWANQAKMQEVYASMMAADHHLTLLILDFPREDRCKTDDWDIALRAFEGAFSELAATPNVCKPKAVLTASLAENIPEVVISRLMKNGIAAIGGLEEALIAAEVAADIGAVWKKAEALPVMSTKGHDIADKTSIITLDEATAKSKLAEYKVPVPVGKVVTSLDEALLVAKKNPYPLVLKALGISHKTEQNAVRLNIQNEQQLKDAFSQLKSLSGSLYLEVMIQQPVAELIVGLSRDLQFGLIMTIGAGGILVELLKDSATLLLPATEGEIAEALSGLKTAPLLRGYRGKPAADIPAAIKAIIAIQNYALDHASQLQELDVNPLIICAEGQGVYAADALIVQNQGEKHV